MQVPFDALGRQAAPSVQIANVPFAAKPHIAPAVAWVTAVHLFVVVLHASASS